MFRTGKYKRAKPTGFAGAGWNMQAVSPAVIEKQEAQKEAKQEEEQVKEDRKKLFRAWQRF